MQQPGHDADDERALDGGDEAGDVERLVQLVVGDVAGQPQQQAVDDDRDQAEGQHVERAADGLDDRLEHGVDHAEDDRDDQQRLHLRRGVVAGEHDSGDQPRGDAEGASRRITSDPEQKLHGPLSTAHRRYAG